VEFLLAGFRRIAGVYRTVVAFPIAVDVFTTPSFWSTFGTIFSGTTGALPSAFAADFTTGS
jgi:hypothetical protein